MNVISSTILRNNLSSVISEIGKNEYLLVTQRGKIASAIVDIDFFEDLIALANKKYVSSIKKAREEYKNGDIFSHGEVFGEV